MMIGKPMKYLLLIIYFAANVNPWNDLTSIFILFIGYIPV